MRRHHVFALVILILAASIGVTAYVVGTGRSPVPISTGKALIGGPFEMTRHDGKRVNQTAFHGKYTLMVFGYTFCPDICPTELQVITAALEKMGKASDAIQPVFVTIDPERDTVEAIAQYVGHFHPRLIGLTGSVADVARIARAYRVYYGRARDDGTSSDYLMDHSSIMYLMGPDGTFVKHFTYSTDASKLADALKKAISG